MELEKLSNSDKNLIISTFLSDNKGEIKLVKEDQSESRLVNKTRSNHNVLPLLFIVFLLYVLYLAWNFPAWLTNKGVEIANTTIEYTQQIAETVIPEEIFRNLKNSYGINSENCLNSVTVKEFCGCISNNSPSVGVKFRVATNGTGEFINNGGQLKSTACFPVNPSLGIGCFMYSYLQNQGSHVVISGNACLIKDFPVLNNLNNKVH